MIWPWIGHETNEFMGLRIGSMLVQEIPGPGFKVYRWEIHRTNWGICLPNHVWYPFGMGMKSRLYMIFVSTNFEQLKNPILIMMNISKTVPKHL